MVYVESRAREYVIAAGVTLLVVASLPLLALLAFTLRGMLILAAAAALVVGALAYAFSAGFRDWFRARSESQVDYKGLRLATDVALHPSHSWARREGEVVVGADDLIQATLGPVDGVELPADGFLVQRGQPLFCLHSGARTIEVPSPVSGIVLGGNRALRRRPELINEEPYARGWVVRLRSDQALGDRRLLLRGKPAMDWFRSAVDRVIGLLSNQGGSVILADGGMLVGQLHDHIDEATWNELTRSVFSSPANDVQVGE